jgi:hypothetical protein
MTTNLKYFQLLQQLEKNPLRPKVAAAFDIADDFRRDMERVGADRRLSAEGRRDATQDLLRKAVRDLRDARAPIAEMEKKLDAKRAAVAMPAFDRSDDYALKLRMELRQTLKTADAGQRALLLAKPAYADALLETEPEASGLFLAEDFKGTISPEIQRDREIVAAAKEKRQAGMFGPQLAEIEELERTLAEANMIPAVARGDIQSDSGLEGREFEELAKKIENRQGAVWLTSDRKQVVEVGAGKATYRPASADEARDGRVFTSAAYEADRVA